MARSRHDLLASHGRRHPLLLGTCNIIFWQLFIATNTLQMGWITTVIHGLLFLLQSFAALCAGRDAARTA